MKEEIHLKDGSVVYAEVTGRTMDGQNGYTLLPPSRAESLAEWLTKSVEIKVVRKGDVWKQE